MAVLAHTTNRKGRFNEPLGDTAEIRPMVALRGRPLRLAEPTALAATVVGSVGARFSVPWISPSTSAAAAACLCDAAAVPGSKINSGRGKSGPFRKTEKGEVRKLWTFENAVSALLNAT